VIIYIYTITSLYYQLPHLFTNAPPPSPLYVGRGERDPTSMQVRDEVNKLISVLIYTRNSDNTVVPVVLMLFEGEDVFVKILL
jgi:hypothetical protein